MNISIPSISPFNIIQRIKQLPSFLLLLSFVELWERFSYYGMRALLVVFLVSQLGFEDARAYAIYSIFAALSYVGPVIGGVLADRLLGFRKTILMGAVINFVGHMLIALVPLGEILFYVGLGFVAVGTGLFKGNISNLLGEFYEKEDPRRDHGFTIFYIGVNIGGFLASVLCGYVAHIFGWHFGFGLAGLGMLFGIIALLRFERVLREKGICPNPELCQFQIPVIKLNLETLVWIGAVIASVACSILLIHCGQTLYIFGLLGLGVTAYILRRYFDATAAERSSLLKLLIYMIFFMFFFALEMQLGSMVVLFTERNVDNVLFGLTIPSTVSQSINPLIILLFGALVSAFWTKRGSGQSVLRFGSGLFLMALSFLVLYLGCQMSNAEGLVNYSYMFLGQAMMSIGELCLAPLILSLATELAPKKMKGFVMGVIMLSLAFSNLSGLLIAKLMAVPKIGTEMVDRLVSLDIYSSGFLKIMIFNVVLTGAFIVLSKVMNLERKV